MSSGEIYTVSAAARASRLSAHTLRAWEARYGVVTPARDDAGRRKYSQSDVDHLALLKQLTDAGHAIGRLAKLDPDELRELQGASGRAIIEDLPEAEKVVQQLMAATMSFDAFELDRQLGRLMGMLPATELVAQVLYPFLRTVGERWAEGELTIAQERLVSSTLQARILGSLAQQSNLRKPRIALGTLSGEHHAMGLMLLALLAQEHGICCRYLGIGMPVESLVQAAHELDVEVLAISVVNPQPEDQLSAVVEELRATLSDEIHLWIGGAQCNLLSDLPSGCELSPNLSDLQALLKSLPTTA